MKLLNLNLCASCLKILSDLVSLFLGNTLLDCLRSCLNEVLSVLKSKAGDLTSNLDYCKLVSACCLKYNVKLGLLLNGSCCCTGSCCNCNGSCGYAELLLKCLYEICKILPSPLTGTYTFLPRYQVLPYFNSNPNLLLFSSLELSAQ